MATQTKRLTYRSLAAGNRVKLAGTFTSSGNMMLMLALVLLLAGLSTKAMAFADQDHDGVPDYKDACPDTPKGLAVHANGCSETPLSTLCLPDSQGQSYPPKCATTEPLAVYFPSDSSHLPQSQWPVLAQIAAFLRTYPAVSLYLVGHTDNQGNKLQNQPLSYRRAELIRTALINDYQIDPVRLKIQAKAASQPAASNQHAHGRSLNRRVAFIVQQRHLADNRQGGQ